MANSDKMRVHLTLTGHIVAVWSDAKAALAEMPKASRGFHVFWLMGPLILLIERSPADAWLTICALAFLVRAILRREGEWLKVFWVRAVFAFWGICLLSASLSEMPAYSLGEAFIWIRFPLFAMASCFWLAKDKRLLFAMMGMTMLGMVMMTGILTAEVLTIGQQGGRLSWPYGDLVPGSYLAKAGLPAFCMLMALSVSGYRPVNNIAAITSTITLILSLMTGERINFMLRLCAGMLAGLVWKPNIIRYAFLLSAFFVALILVTFAMPDIANRFMSEFVQQLPSNIESPYFRVMNGALIIFKTAPILGIGPDVYRMLCPEIVANAIHVDCNTHPHNYYLQILAETGIIGLMGCSIMIVSMICFCIRGRVIGNESPLLSVAFVVPLALFFPIQSTADFFGQWNNIFMWSAVALSLSLTNLRKH